MTFSISGSTITQTGVDADLSGLASITGVDIFQQGSHTVYSVGDRRLNIQGDLSIDPEFEEIVFGDGAPFRTMDVLSGGILNVGREINIGAEQNAFSTGVMARFTDPSTDTFRETEASFRVSSGGTFNWFGGAMYANNPIAFMEGSFVTIHSQNCQVVMQTDGVQIRQRSENLDVRGLVTKGCSLTMISNALQLRGWRPFDSGNRALSFSTSTPDGQFYVIEDFDARGLNGQQVAFWSDVWGRLVGSSEGTGIIAAGNSNNSSSNRGYYEIRQPTEINVSAFSGGSIAETKVYTADTDNGDRLSAGVFSGNESYLVDREYEHTFDALGSHTFDIDGGILTGCVYQFPGGPMNANITYDRRSINNDSTDVFRFSFCQYLYTIGVRDVPLRGIGGTVINQVMFDDSLITELDRTIVNGYASIDTAAQFYDRAKSFLYDNWGLYVDLIASREGETIDTGSFNVTIDPNASSAFDFDGSTITIRTSNFIGSIVTQGTITLANGAGVTGSTTDQNGMFVTLTVNVSDTAQNPIGNARVLIQSTDSSPVNIAIGETDASGRFSCPHMFTANKQVLVRARKSTESPFYTPNEQFEQITQMGLNSNLTLLLDE